MRLRIYTVEDGRLVPDWGPNTPAHAGSPSRGGHLVTGGPGKFEQARITQRLRNQAERDKLAETLRRITGAS